MQTTAKEVLSEAEERFERLRRRVGFYAAPLALVVVYGLTAGRLSEEGRRLSAVLACTLVLWVTESLPMPMTAVMAASLCILLGVADAKTVLAPFGDPIVFLFIGSFMLARAMMLHRLDHRFALAILSLRWVRGHPARLLGALGLVTAAISMWVSNTATTAMMLPIALGLLHARQGLRTSEGSPLEVRRWPYATGFFSGQPYAQISSPALTATSAPGGNNSWPTRTNAGWRSPSASPPGRCATRSMLNLEGRAAALYWECEGPENRMMMGQEKFLGKFFEGKKEILGEYRIHSQSTLKTQFSGFGGRGCNLCPVAKGIETWMAVGVPMLVVM